MQEFLSKQNFYKHQMHLPWGYQNIGSALPLPQTLAQSQPAIPSPFFDDF